MEQTATQSKGKAGAEDWITHSHGLILARSGRLQLARHMSRQAVELALQAGQRERAATYEAGAATWEAFFGNKAAARERIASALNLAKGRDVEYAAAFASGLAGDLSLSQTLTNDLEKQYPEDTSVQFNYLPTLRALYAINHNDPRQAIELLQAAGPPHELAISALDFFACFGTLYPVYMRGQAYLAAHQGAEAATEFQKILDHRGIVLGDPTGALAHLQLGRAYTLTGDKTKARAAYQDFLALWEDADSDIPILKEAKTEYGKLQ